MIFQHLPPQRGSNLVPKRGDAALLTGLLLQVEAALELAQEAELAGELSEASVLRREASEALERWAEEVALAEVEVLMAGHYDASGCQPRGPVEVQCASCRGVGSASSRARAAMKPAIGSAC